MFTIQEVECLGACANAPMIQVNGEWVYEDLTPENTVQLLENLKNGTDKKGPQIDRNDCEGPMGRTTLKVIFILFFRIMILMHRSDSSVTLPKQSRIGNKPKGKRPRRRRERQKKQRESKNSVGRQKQRKYDLT